MDYLPNLIADLTTCDVNVSLDWISKGVALFKNLLSGPITRNSISNFDGEKYLRKFEGMLVGR